MTLDFTLISSPPLVHVSQCTSHLPPHHSSARFDVIRRSVNRCVVRRCFVCHSEEVTRLASLACLLLSFQKYEYDVTHYFADRLVRPQRSGRPVDPRCRFVRYCLPVRTGIVVVACFVLLVPPAILLPSPFLVLFVLGFAVFSFA